MITTDEFMLGASLAALAGLGIAAVVGEHLKKPGHRWVSTGDPTPRADHYQGPTRTDGYQPIPGPRPPTPSETLLSKTLKIDPKVTAELVDDEMGAHKAAAWQTVRDRMFPPSLQHYWVPNGDRPGPDGRWWVFLGGTRTIWGFDSAVPAVDHADHMNRVEQRGKYKPGFTMGVVVPDWVDRLPVAEGLDGIDLMPGWPKGLPYKRPVAMRGDTVEYEMKFFTDPPHPLDGWEAVPAQSYQWRNQTNDEWRAGLTDEDPRKWDLTSAPLTVGMDFGSGPDETAYGISAPPGHQNYIALVPKSDPSATGYVMTNPNDRFHVRAADGEVIEVTQAQLSAPGAINAAGEYVGPLADAPGAHYEVINTGDAVLPWSVVLTAEGRPAVSIGPGYVRASTARGRATKLNRAADYVLIDGKWDRIVPIAPDAIKRTKNG